MPKKRNTFPKWERLCNKKAITSLFESADSIFVFPLKIFYKPTGLPNNRILITIPKRSHKKAVCRNLLKRRLKECWRVGDRYGISGMDITIVHISSTVTGFEKLEKSLADGLAKIKANIDKSGLSATISAD